jgi:hypothetical protein
MNTYMGQKYGIGRSLTVVSKSFCYLSPLRCNVYLLLSLLVLVRFDNPPLPLLSLYIPNQDMDPPKDPSVQVRCVKDHGSVVFSIGSVNLAKDTAHLLPREEAEPFISSGVLVYMD